RREPTSAHTRDGGSGGNTAAQGARLPRGRKTARDRDASARKGSRAAVSERRGDARCPGGLRARKLFVREPPQVRELAHRALRGGDPEATPRTRTGGPTSQRAAGTRHVTDPTPGDDRARAG